MIWKLGSRPGLGMESCPGLSCIGSDCHVPNNNGSKLPLSPTIRTVSRRLSAPRIAYPSSPEKFTTYSRSPASTSFSLRVAAGNISDADTRSMRAIVRRTPRVTGSLESRKRLRAATASPTGISVSERRLSGE